MTNLTVAERLKIDEQATRVVRSRLDTTKPDMSRYDMKGNRAAALITSTMMWAKLFVLVIAVFAAIASAIRTVQAAAEIYTAAGASPLGVAIAAVAFTVSVEGALFTLALAEEGELLRQRSEGKSHRVYTLRDLWNGVLIRLGVREQIDLGTAGGGNMRPVMLIAFAFAVIANAFMGFRPLLAQIGTVSLQQFFAAIWTSPASLQLTFLLDLAGILFPPLMALSAGHLTARFAAEIAAQSQSAIAAYEHDLAVWRAQYADPLNTEQGKPCYHNSLRSVLPKSQSEARRIEQALIF